MDQYQREESRRPTGMDHYVGKGNKIVKVKEAEALRTSLIFTN